VHPPLPATAPSLLESDNNSGRVHLRSQADTYTLARAHERIVTRSVGSANGPSPHAYYLGSATSNHQFRLAVTPGLGHINLESPCSQAICRVSDSSVDSVSRFLPSDSVIGKDQIQID
jgi:hypothetical protein